MGWNCSCDTVYSSPGLCWALRPQPPAQGWIAPLLRNGNRGRYKLFVCIKHVFVYLLCLNLQALNVCICLHSSGLTNIYILHRAFLKLSNPQSCNVEEFHGGRLVSCYILCLETWDIPGGQSGELYKHATTYYVWILISGAWHCTMYSK